MGIKNMYISVIPKLVTATNGILGVLGCRFSAFSPTVQICDTLAEREVQMHTSVRLDPRSESN
jgi:hypothetical protein